MFKINLFTVLFIIVSCSGLETKSQEREYQFEVNKLLADKSKQFSECAKNHQLFDTFDQKRVRVELIFKLNAKGEIEQFHTDDRDYPNSFVNCIFAHMEKIKFPDLSNQELSAKFNQPFIFRN